VDRFIALSVVEEVLVALIVLLLVAVTKDSSSMTNVWAISSSIRANENGGAAERRAAPGSAIIVERVEGDSERLPRLFLQAQL
tara:strand:- start:23223 stop:23471 length:249 start_codon:yes stop_codon:yes gene_type:complete